MDEGREKAICYLDGNALCIVNEDFINLVESDAMFVELSYNQIKEFEKLVGEGEK